MPENKNQTQAAPIAPIEPSTAPKAEIVPEAVFEPKNPPHRSLQGVIIGAVFLAVSVVGALGLVMAYVPIAKKTAAQTAAAALPKEDFFAPLALASKGAYVYDAKNDTEIFSKGGTLQLPLASITKIALVLTVSEVLNPDQVITISRGAVERGEGGLTWGEEWKVRDLIDFTLITSSNTGAEALAEAADPLLATKYPSATQTNATVWRMNALAQSLGMNETYFLNPTGLDASPTQAGAMSSARDIAKLFEYALRTNRSLFSSTVETDIPLGPSNAPWRDAHNTNNLLAEIPNLLMGKTGTTDLAGGNLAIAFDVEPNHPVVVVVLGSTAESRFADVKLLAEAAQKTIINTAY
jgi:serine-type D-Ala-D-Ala carboxypeptidase (penicillin-binding protein 5/6)